MNVQEFLTYFRNDILEDSSFKGYNDYKKWHSLFFEKSKAFQISSKQSYFEQLSQLVDSGNYSDYYEFLSEFSYLNIFTEDDEIQFANFIRKLAKELNKIEKKDKMEVVLIFIYSLSDFLLHHFFPITVLKEPLKELKDRIFETRKLDHEKTGELVIRFIDLMI